VLTLEGANCVPTDGSALFLACWVPNAWAEQRHLWLLGADKVYPDVSGDGAIGWVSFAMCLR